MQATQERPTTLAGGCLCAAIRYEISFSEPGQWPPTLGDCDCTMCRKWTGALLYQNLAISADQLSPPLSSFASYKEYESSPGRFRGFCSQCGSSLIWRSEREGERHKFEVMIGSFDEKWLKRNGDSGEGGVEGILGEMLEKKDAGM
ncbi:Mss4-like protein [Aspergillus heterothallicus]